MAPRHSLLAEPWTARGKRLEDLLEAPPPGVCLVPVTDDAPALWDTWVGMGGEGIVLSLYLADGGVIKSTGDNMVEGNGAGTILGGSLTTPTKRRDGTTTADGATAVRRASADDRRIRLERSAHLPLAPGPPFR